MGYNSDKHHRRSIRLKNYDYSRAGLYFVTVCTQDKVNLFGSITDGEMNLNDAGQVVREEWEKSEKIRKEIKLHEYIIMPNHFHAIVEIVGANGRSPVQLSSPVQSRLPMPHMQAKSLGSLIAGFKSSTSKKINIIRKKPRFLVWQRNYWEHIVRNNDEFARIQNYIIENPKMWNNDKLNNGMGNMIMERIAIYNEKFWMI